MHVTIFSKGKECNVGFFGSISVTHGHESDRKSWHKCVPIITQRICHQEAIRIKMQYTPPHVSVPVV